MILPSDLERAADVSARRLSALPPDRWSRPADHVGWSCHDTVRHVVDVLVGYSMGLASALRGPWPALRCDVSAPERLPALRGAATLLATVAAATPPDVRAHHAAGPADAEGFLAMAIDELLVHTSDICAADAPSFRPPPELAVAVLDRLFPWWPRSEDPVAALAWANGRAALPGCADPGARWLWHSAPVAEWDGAVPTWDPDRSRPADG